MSSEGAERRKARMEQALNGWVIILLEGNNQQGDKIICKLWSEVEQSLKMWMNPENYP